MAHRVEHHPLDAAFAALLANGLDGAGEALRILVNEASKIERNSPSPATRATLHTLLARVYA